MKKKKNKVKEYLPLYLMMLPGLLYLLINNYLPMTGIILAFKKLNFSKGILASPWAGLDNFKFLFSSKDAWIITRNTLLYNAVINGIDYFLYWDDDEYPVACVKSRKNGNIKWKIQNNILGHLENIENADITFGHRCGYNSPLPYMELKNPFHERRIKAFIEAVKNEFMTWEDVKGYLSKDDGIAYADEELMKKNTVSEIQIQGTHKRILGSPLCLNLKHLDKIPAFYNPEGARGEDAFFSLLLNENKVISVPVYHFHDPFIKFNNVLEGKYPRKIDKTKSNDKSVEQRFYKVARGWIKYRPLYLYATDKENYEKEIKKK